MNIEDFKSGLIGYLIRSPKFQDFLKHKAHDWLPAYFSRYDLTPEENLLIAKKNALESALLSQDQQKLEEILDLFPELINQPLNSGEIAITFAVKYGLHHTIDLLLQKGADPSTKDRIGLNALDIALQKKEKELFAKLIASTTFIGSADEILKILNSTTVSGISAKNSLSTIQRQVNALKLSLPSLSVPKEVQSLYSAIISGNYVEFRQLVTQEKLNILKEKVNQEALFQAIILGSPLIFEQMLNMGFTPPLIEDSTKHPMRLAFCSQHPIESYISLFAKCQFDIHSIASSYRPKGSISWISPEYEQVSYFDLLVYKKIKNAEALDPLAITAWDVAFSLFSLFSLLGNYQFQIVPPTLLPFIRLGLNCANYFQAISLLLFKLSYSREGKLSAALQQLMTHYFAAQYAPVRIYYAWMTIYSAGDICFNHRYRSWTDLSKKIIVQMPATCELVYYVANTAQPYFQSWYNKFFGITNSNQFRSTNSMSSSSSLATPSNNEVHSKMFENTPFMEKFSNNSFEALTQDVVGQKANPEGTISHSGQTVVGTIFKGENWALDKKDVGMPDTVSSYSAAIELGQNFQQNTEWYQSIKGTKLGQDYREMHLQAALATSVKKYANGFSLQGAFRVDFTGINALQHFIQTIVEGGAHFEQVNTNILALQEMGFLKQGSLASATADSIDCFLTGRKSACLNSLQTLLPYVQQYNPKMGQRLQRQLLEERFKVGFENVVKPVVDHIIPD